MSVSPTLHEASPIFGTPFDAPSSTLDHVDTGAAPPLTPDAPATGKGAAPPLTPDAQATGKRPSTSAVQHCSHEPTDSSKPSTSSCADAPSMARPPPMPATDGLAAASTPLLAPTWRGSVREAALAQSPARKRIAMCRAVAAAITAWPSGLGCTKSRPPCAYSVCTVRRASEPPRAAMPLGGPPIASTRASSSLWTRPARSITSAACWCAAETICSDMESLPRRDQPTKTIGARGAVRRSARSKRERPPAVCDVQEEAEERLRVSDTSAVCLGASGWDPRGDMGSIWWFESGCRVTLRAPVVCCDVKEDEIGARVRRQERAGARRKVIGADCILEGDGCAHSTLFADWRHRARSAATLIIAPRAAIAMQKTLQLLCKSASPGIWERAFGIVGPWMRTRISRPGFFAPTARRDRDAEDGDRQRLVTVDALCYVTPPHHVLVRIHRVLCAYMPLDEVDDARLHGLQRLLRGRKGGLARRQEHAWVRSGLRVHRMKKTRRHVCEQNCVFTEDFFSRNPLHTADRAPARARVSRVTAP